MSIWNDEVVQRLYARLSNDERSGFELAITILREVYPKIDIYESTLGNGPALSAGKKSIGRTKGKPLFVIKRPTKDKSSFIRIRIDSITGQQEVENALGRTWKEIKGIKFYLKDFPKSSKNFSSYLKRLQKSAANVVEKRANGNGYNPSDYNELSEYPAENEQGLIEGAKMTVAVNKYERNRKARMECIAHHGAACFFCGFDYGEKYGGAYAGFIHVHHIIPLSKINEEYQVNPKRDLVPVCPNCHAVIHFGGDALSLEKAKSILSSHNKAN